MLPPYYCIGFHFGSVQQVLWSMMDIVDGEHCRMRYCSEHKRKYTYEENGAIFIYLIVGAL